MQTTEKIFKRVGEYSHVRLRESELQNLIETYGEENVNIYIEKLDNFLEEKNGTCRDCFSKLDEWMSKDNVKERKPRKVTSYRKVKSSDGYDPDKYKCRINDFSDFDFEKAREVIEKAEAEKQKEREREQRAKTMGDRNRIAKEIETAMANVHLTETDKKRMRVEIDEIEFGDDEQGRRLKAVGEKIKQKYLS